MLIMMITTIIVITSNNKNMDSIVEKPKIMQIKQSCC